MNRKIYIIRHGQKVKTSGDPPLSDFGKKQAKKTAEYIKFFPIKTIASSPILRTKQTAKFIANEFGLEFEVNDLLKERVNWGDDPNQSFEDFLSMWRRSSRERTWKPPVGDSSYRAGERLMKILLDPKYKEIDSLVLVTHGGIITDFLRNIFSVEYLNEFVPDFENKLEESVKECSITILETSDDSNEKFKLIKYAYTDHLDEL